MTTDPAGRVAPHSGGTVAELVTRLRTDGRVYTHMEAADLIERQHAEIERLDNLVHKWRDEASALLARAMVAELAAARAALAPTPAEPAR